MSWFPEQSLSWFERFCCNVLKAGDVPEHIALIMDGNRRFAVKQSMVKIDGHVRGFNKLAQTLEWCHYLGIKEVTVYAFSIENFKRSKDEVDGLLELAKQKFETLMGEKEKLMEHGVCVRIMGDLSLLPKDLKKTIADLVLLTKNNSKAILNVCLSYTSREEISTAIREIGHGVEMEIIKPSDVSEELIDRCLYTNKSKDPDLLIRTSGEVRFSDFLLWQCAYSVIDFVKVLWPEFSIWHMFAAVLTFQINKGKLQEAKEQALRDRENLVKECDLECIKQLDDKAGLSDEELLRKQTDGREQRIDTFLKHLEAKRSTALLEMSQPV